jgi:integrase
LSVERPEDTDTYCYRGVEVEEILKHCWSDPQLHWLARVVLFLCMTGLRISELINLHWSDVDLDANLLRLPDRRRSARKSQRATARGTKSGRSRALPLHPDLRRMLESMTRAPDGLILHAAKGGKLDDDKIRKVFIRDVIEPLASKFPKAGGEKGFADGRLHSFRHYFISLCASNQVDIEVLKKWMGHRDSKMINYYYHLHAEESQKQIKRIQPAGGADASWRPKIPQNDTPNTRSTPEQNGKNNGDNNTEKT